VIRTTKILLVALVSLWGLFDAPGNRLTLAGSCQMVERQPYPRSLAGF